ncbi:MAG: ATP-dependent DNA helicase [Culicoidibacterales bacterium]
MSLNPCQQKALNRAVMTDKHLTISGPAGSGKSYLTKALLDALDEKLGIALVTPTHAAKNILTEMSGQEATTIHGLFKIHPSTYEDVRTFSQSDDIDVSAIRVLIIDEASMVDDELLGIILKSISKHCRIIAIGDKAQLQPVKHDPGHVSSLFDKYERKARRVDVNGNEHFEVIETIEFEQIELKTVQRQAMGPLLDVATEVRNGMPLRSAWDKERKIGILEVNSIKQMLNALFKKLTCPEDLMNYRAFAFTNNIVNKINDQIRKHVYNATEPFVDGEFLVMQEPVMEGEGKTQVAIIANGEIVRIKEGSINRKTISISLPEVSAVEIEAADIIVINDDDKEIEIEVVWDLTSKDILDEIYHEAAGIYKSSSYNKNNWKAFWNLKGRFADTKTLGACTVHKSQGCTVTGSVFYTQDMGYADASVQRQLMYVAVTRSTDWVLYY